VVREICRQNGQAAHTKSATKLQWLPSKNLLFVGSVQGGSFGFSGYMRLWDLRSNKTVWDWKEPNFQKVTRGGEQDCFADMTVDEELGVVFKVGVQSGALSLADLRNLDVADPWLELVDTGVPEKGEGSGGNKKLIAYNQQVCVIGVSRALLLFLCLGFHRIPSTQPASFTFIAQPLSRALMICFVRELLVRFFFLPLVFSIANPSTQSVT